MHTHIIIVEKNGVRLAYGLRFEDGNTGTNDTKTKELGSNSQQGHSKGFLPKWQSSCKAIEAVQSNLTDKRTDKFQ